MQQYVDQLLQRWGMPEWLWNITVIVGSILLGWLISMLLGLFVQKEKKNNTESVSKFVFLQSALHHVATPISVLVPLMIFNTFLPALEMPAVFKMRLAHAVEIALIIVSAWTVIRFINVMQDLVHNRVNINTADNLRQRRVLTQLMYVRRVVVSIVIVITIGAVLLTFASMRKIGTGLLTSVGIGGIIVGFAAQRSLANLLAGFQIAFTQPIRIDDQVIVEGEFGRIEEITLTYVVVHVWDDRRLILPINYFIEKPFQNWSRTSVQITATVYFYLDYRISVEWVRTQMMEIIKNNPLWDKRGAGLQVTNLKSDSIELRAIVTCANPGDSWNMQCLLREQMLSRINDQFPDSLPRTRAELVGDSDSKLLQHESEANGRS